MCRRASSGFRRAHRHGGFTLIEMVVVVLIVSILASAAMPLMALHKRRTQEAELRQSLRTLRGAIDRYKQAYDAGRIENQADASGYPPSLDVLVKGVPELGAAAVALAPSAAKAGDSQKASSPFDASSFSGFSAPNGGPKRIYFLRSLPRDPFADPSLPAEQTWGLRSYASPPEAPAPGADVFDVHSRTEGQGLDGTPYRQW